MEECEDRIKGDLMRYQVERNPAFENNTVIPLSDIPDVECDEDWNLPQVCLKWRFTSLSIEICCFAFLPLICYSPYHSKQNSPLNYFCDVHS